MGRAPARHDQGPRVHTRASARVSTPLLRSHEARHGRPEQSGHNAWDERRRITTTRHASQARHTRALARVSTPFLGSEEARRGWPDRVGPGPTLTLGASAGASRRGAAPPQLVMRGRRPAHPRLFCDRRKQDVGGRNSPAITHGASAGIATTRHASPAHHTRTLAHVSLCGRPRLQDDW